MDILRSAISVCLFFSGCSFNESAIVRDMDKAYNAVETNGYNQDKIDSIRNQSVTNAVLKNIGSMKEDSAVSYLVSAEFIVIKYEENGFRIINDGNFKPYKDEPFKKSARSNMQGSSRYFATKTYKHCIFCGYEARVIFDVNNSDLVNLRGYVFFQSI